MLHKYALSSFPFTVVYFDRHEEQLFLLCIDQCWSDSYTSSVKCRGQAIVSSVSYRHVFIVLLDLTNINFCFYLQNCIIIRAKNSIILYPALINHGTAYCSFSHCSFVLTSSSIYKKILSADFKELYLVFIFSYYKNAWFNTKFIKKNRNYCKTKQNLQNVYVIISRVTFTKNLTWIKSLLKLKYLTSECKIDHTFN